MKIGVQAFLGCSAWSDANTNCQFMQNLVNAASDAGVNFVS
jgi:hypothetical protein